MKHRHLFLGSAITAAALVLTTHSFAVWRQVSAPSCHDIFGTSTISGQAINQTGDWADIYCGMINDDELPAYTAQQVRVYGEDRNPYTCAAAATCTTFYGTYGTTCTALIQSDSYSGSSNCTGSFTGNFGLSLPIGSCSGGLCTGWANFFGFPQIVVTLPWASSGLGSTFNGVEYWRN